MEKGREMLPAAVGQYNACTRPSVIRLIHEKVLRDSAFLEKGGGKMDIDVP